MRSKTTAIIGSVMLLAAAHGPAAMLASDPSTINPQAAEAKAQETVNLAVSGMT